MADTITTASTEEVRSRKGHLGRLALIFFRRGASWVDFREFLVALFNNEVKAAGRRNTRSVAGRFHVQKCRHGPGGRHFDELRRLTTVVEEDRPALFNSHAGFSRPCLGFGKGDDNKAPGLVMYDLCKDARAWLATRGKGRVIRSATPRHHRALGHVPDDLAHLQLDAEVLPHAHPIPEWSEFVLDNPEAWRLWEELCSMGLYPTLIDEDPDAQEIEYQLGGLSFTGHSGEEEDRPMSDTLLSSDPGVQSSPNTGIANARTSTKIRVHTLAYLKGANNDTTAFRTRFFQLREQDELVLHLCGCGIKFTNPEHSDGPQECSGCCEPTHLRLGTSETNLRHRYFHTVMNLVQVADYGEQCRLAWRGQDDCDGIF